MSSTYYRVYWDMFDEELGYVMYESESRVWVCPRSGPNPFEWTFLLVDVISDMAGFVPVSPLEALVACGSLPDLTSRPFPEERIASALEALDDIPIEL